MESVIAEVGIEYYLGSLNNDFDLCFTGCSLTSPNHASLHQILDADKVREAAAYGNDGNESLDAKAQKALECPCIADLRSGPCGAQFSEAFLCFLKSTAEEKGSDCVNPFVALQNCSKANPDAFSKDVLEEDEVKNEQEENQQLRIIPPLWTKESQTPKSKL
ncbi:hypothetical protein FEM48_Zijuj07G0016000 [Ziziphus jujuba var. spinosa]|uniref:Mitochondrial intermembrane space import and assembly protein 40 homolog n=1 Tax=Ziziphus jujuba var. spinosa TaxID=714518 RepID=A0A978V1P5_ZIZJJ|nr:hypothetical protein FEM48_Zijuj07G0016000 [Ziziphus jujuba var. spinosa]